MASLKDIGLKGSRRDYTAREKREAAGRGGRALGDLEGEIVRLKKSVKRRVTKLDVLRALARDMRAGTK